MVAVTESVARTQTFKELFTLIKENMSGWYVVSKFPEVEPNFPCVVVHKVILEDEGISFTRGARSINFKQEIELFAGVKEGMDKIDSGLDTLSALFKNSTNLSTLLGFNIDVKDIDELPDEQVIFNQSKLNMGGVEITGEILI